MTKEENIKNLKKIKTVGLCKQYLNTIDEVIKALEQPTMDKAMIHTLAKENDELKAEIGRLRQALEQQPTTQQILSHIETGITATGQSDSYCVGFCNALVWLKACITHEEPQFFEDGKVSEISTGSTTTDDCVSRKFMYELGATCIATRDKNDKLIALGTIDELPPVTPTHGTCKDCSHYDPLTCNSGTCLNPNMQWSNEVSATHYCADFEKRGSENESNN